MAPVFNMDGEQDDWLRRQLAADSDLLRRFAEFEANGSDFVEPHVRVRARRIQNNLSRLMPEDLRTPLSPFEVFVLVYATQLYDVGIRWNIDQGQESEDFRSEDFRVDVFNRSRQFVIAHKSDLCLSAHEARIIGEVCRAHGMTNLDYLAGQLFSVSPYGEIRVELLSALLRLAAVLDLPAVLSSENNAVHVAHTRLNAKNPEVCRAISDVQIRPAPAWDIVIVAMPDLTVSSLQLYDLRNTLQQELDTISSVLRAAEIYYKKVELRTTSTEINKSHPEVKNPFLLLAPFSSHHARLFAGRDKETQEVVERVVGRRLVTVIGESGVGKTSLIEAAVIPKLRQYDFRIIRFSFQDDPIESLISTVTSITKRHDRSTDVMECLSDLPETDGRKKRILLLGDHLEQMFTVGKEDAIRKRFLRETTRILASNEPFTFLFCIREDYLPDLYVLSNDMPELYSRDNTFRLHRLSRENGMAAFAQASDHAVTKMPSSLIERIADDLCYEGGGLVFPPFLQIVGRRLYATANRGRINGAHAQKRLAVSYNEMGGVKRIVNEYLEGLLDQYVHNDKAMVGRILGMMVTEHRTKKRVRLEEIQDAVPECEQLEGLLNRLVKQRIVRRSLQEYELIHDFLARKVIDFISEKRFLSPPVRKALEFIESEASTIGLRCEEIAKAAGVTQPHLAALFQQQLDSSIIQELGRTRIVMAKRLLGQDRDKLKEIATSVGFKSLSAFSRKFKEQERVSPQEYRKGLINSWTKEEQNA